MLNKAQTFNFIGDQVINVDDPRDRISSSYSPIPGAAWVKDLKISAAELSDWLSDSISDPSDPYAIYAGMGATGDMYVVALSVHHEFDHLKPFD
jgi:hypothetical protein